METTPYERRRGPYEVSCDRGRLDVGVIHGYLTRSYWAEGIPRSIVERSIEGSLPFGLYHEGRQVGFARVVTDHATFGYLADVFVLEEHRGSGLGVWLMECVFAHPDLQGFRRFVLATRDAHGLYAKFAFTPLGLPATFMERCVPDIYRRTAGGTKG